MRLGPTSAELSPARIALAGGAAAALVDGGSVSLSGAPIQALLLGGADLALCGLWASAVFPLALALHSAARAERAWLRVSAVGAGILLNVLGAVLIVRPVGRSGALAYWVVASLLGVGMGVYQVVATRVQPPRTARTLACAAGAIALALDLWLDRTVYSEFHATLQWAAWVGLALAACGRSERALGWRRTLAEYAVVAAASSVTLAALQGRDDIHTAGVLRGRWFGSLAFVGAPYLDTDGDGMLTWLWGGDCDGTRADVYPGAEDPRDGRDSNCNGVIDAEDTAAQRGLGPDVGDPQLPEGAVQWVLLVTLDTFRPELLSAEIMPHSHALSREGMGFARAYANASSTVRSMPYFFRAQHDAPPVDELLRRHGIAVYRHNDVAAVLKRLGEPSQTRALIHLHLLYMHAPYELHPEVPTPPAPPPLDPAYVNEAAFTDRQLRPLWEALRAPPLVGRAALILTGDHGEGAGEHGVVGHTRSPWDEVLRVPLVVVAPGVEPGVRRELTSTRSVPATLLGAFGLGEEARAAERFGRSLWRRRSASAAPWQRFVVVETSRSASGAIQRGPVGVLVTARYKLVRGIHDRAVQLFDLQQDPGETVDLALRRPALVQQLSRRFAVAQDLGAVRPELARSAYQLAAGR